MTPRTVVLRRRGGRRGRACPPPTWCAASSARSPPCASAAACRCRSPSRSPGSSRSTTRAPSRATDGVLVVARPRRAFRRRELAGLRPLLACFSRVAHLDMGTIEGGEIMLRDGAVLVAWGRRRHPTRSTRCLAPRAGGDRVGDRRARVRGPRDDRPRRRARDRRARAGARAPRRVHRRWRADPAPPDARRPAPAPAPAPGPTPQADLPGRRPGSSRA